MTLITPKEFAQRLMVTERTVNNYIRQNKLPVLQVGSITRIDWNKFVSMNTANPQSPRVLVPVMAEQEFRTAA